MTDTLPGDRTGRPVHVAPDEPRLEPEASGADEEREEERSERELEPDPGPEAEPEPSPEPESASGLEPASSLEPESRPEPWSSLEPESTPEPDAGPVLAPEATSEFQVRWSSIQAGFVDDPRHAVETADRFVADVAQAFASGVESRRRTLTSAWSQDGQKETEELRLTMQQYRALVDRILLG
jgi:hypothetical protein